MKDNITTTEAAGNFKASSVGQLELTFERGCTPRPNVRRRQYKGARWWFNQMRQVVNRAGAWSPAREPRAQQTFLELPSRS